jgi:rhodanese-related sulfurtransferase
MLLGTALTAIVWPAFGAVAAAAPREAARLPADLGWPLWTVVALVTVLGVAASMVARRVEKPSAANSWWRPTTLESIALALAFAFSLAGGRSTLTSTQVSAIAAQIYREDDHVDPLDLADMIRARRLGLRVIDVREGLDSSIYRIPGAESLPLDALTTLEISPREHVVLYSDGGAHAAQAWVLLRARGFTDVKVLKDGMAAWEDEVLGPTPPLTPDDTAQRRFKRARELAIWFGGHPRLEPLGAGAPARPAATSAPRRRRRNTC